MSLINKVAYSGEIDTKRKPYFGEPAEGKKPFARFVIVQRVTVEENGDSGEKSFFRDVKVFGKQLVDTLRAAWERTEKSEKVMIELQGRLASEKAKGEQRVYTKKGAKEESRADLYETIIVVDGEDTAHSLTIAGEKETKKKAA